MANLHASPHRRIIYRRILVRRFELENHGAQAVVAAAYRYAALVYPVAEVEERIASAKTYWYIAFHASSQSPSGFA